RPNPPGPRTPAVPRRALRGPVRSPARRRGLQLLWLADRFPRGPPDRISRRLIRSSTKIGLLAGKSPACRGNWGAARERGGCRRRWRVIPAATVAVRIDPAAISAIVIRCEPPVARHIWSWPRLMIGTNWSTVYRNGFHTGLSSSLI